MHDVTNYHALVREVAGARCRPEADVPIAQEDRPARNLSQFHERGDQAVDVPRTARHIEDGILLGARRAIAERLVEGGHARKGQTRVGIAEHESTRRLEKIGDARLDDRVIEIADHTELRAP